MQRPGAFRLRRFALGLSLLEVGNALGVSQSIISLHERGLRTSADLESRLEEFLSQQERLTTPKRTAAS